MSKVVALKLSSQVIVLVLYPSRGGVITGMMVSKNNVEGIILFLLSVLVPFVLVFFPNIKFLYELHEVENKVYAHYSKLYVQPSYQDLPSAPECGEKALHVLDLKFCSPWGEPDNMGYEIEYGEEVALFSFHDDMKSGSINKIKNTPFFLKFVSRFTSYDFSLDDDIRTYAQEVNDKYYHGNNYKILQDAMKITPADIKLISSRDEFKKNSTLLRLKFILYREKDIVFLRVIHLMACGIMTGNTVTLYITT